MPAARYWSSLIKTRNDSLEGTRNQKKLYGYMITLHSRMLGLKLRQIKQL